MVNGDSRSVANDSRRVTDDSKAVTNDLPMVVVRGMTDDSWESD